SIGLGLACLLCGAGVALGQASLTTSGYSETFDSMGTSGSAPPTGWKHFLANFGSNTTWAGSIPASGSNSMASTAASATSTALSATTTPSGTTPVGFNAARAASATSDRVIATSPTGIAGSIIQLQLRNDTGADLPTGSAVNIAFDTVRYTVANATNELPGYW